MLCNMFNVLKTSNQKRVSIVKIKYSKNCVNVLQSLLKEGFIRGYFISLDNNFKVIYILLKYLACHNLNFSFKFFESVNGTKQNNFKYQKNILDLKVNSSLVVKIF